MYVIQAENLFLKQKRKAPTLGKGKYSFCEPEKPPSWPFPTGRAKVLSPLCASKDAYFAS